MAWQDWARPLTVSCLFWEDFLICLWPDTQVAELQAGMQWAAGASLWNPNPQPFPDREAGHRAECELPYIAWLAASGSRSPVL